MKARTLLPSIVVALSFFSQAEAANNTVSNIVTGTNGNLNTAGNFSAAPGTTSDVTFKSGVTYIPTAYTLNTSSTWGTLDDLSATAVTIDNTSGTADAINLAATAKNNTGTANPGSGSSVNDFIFVASGSNLAIGTASTSALGVNLGTTSPNTAVSGSITNNGTLTIGPSTVLSFDGSTAGQILSLLGSGNTTVSGELTSTNSNVLNFNSTGTLTIAGTSANTGLGEVADNFTLTAGTVNLATAATNSGLLTGHIIMNGGTFTEASGGVIRTGSGTDITVNGGLMVLAGANSFSGPAGTTVTGGTVLAESGSAIGGNTVTVSGTGNLSYVAPNNNTKLALASNANLTITGGSGATIGGSIGSSTTGDQITVSGTGVAAATGAVKVNIYGAANILGTTGTYTLISEAAAGTLTSATYSLGTVYNNTNFTVGAITASTTALKVAITNASALTSAYWAGGLTGNTNVWAASNGTTASNWVTSVGGSNQALVPGSYTNVFFSDTGHITTAPTATVLGANMNIGTLTIQDTVNGMVLNADGNTLTISGAGGITVNGSVPASSIAASVALGANQAWTNNSANTFTVSGVVSGAFGLTTQGTGTTVLSGANTYSGGTTVGGGTLKLGNATALGSTSAALTVSGGGTLDLNANAQTVGALTLGDASNGGSTLADSSTANTLTASGGVTVIGTNNTINSGVTVSGAVTQNSGSALAVNGVIGTDNLASTASLVGAGTTGAVTLNGSDTLSSGSTLTTASISVNGAGNAISSGTVGGNATINSGGALAVNGTSTGSMTVKTGGALAGTGTVAGINATDTTAGTAAKIYVGQTSTAGTSTTTNLTTTAASSFSNANLVFNLAASPTSGTFNTSPGLGTKGTGSEMVVAGTSTAVTFGSGVTLTLNLQNEPNVVPGYTSYVLFAGNVGTNGSLFNATQYSGSGLTYGATLTTGTIKTTQVTGLTLNFGSGTDNAFYQANSYVFILQNSTDGTDDLEVEVVPEPSTWAMMLGGLAVLVCWQRRRSANRCFQS